MKTYKLIKDGTLYNGATHLVTDGESGDIVACAEIKQGNDEIMKLFWDDLNAYIPFEDDNYEPQPQPLPEPEPGSLEEEIRNMANKYFELVWYARRPPRSDTEWWNDLPAETREKASLAMANIQDRFPAETAAIADPEIGTWTHGFNSGCLATFRFILTAMDSSEFGGLKQAKEEFPFLDS